MTYQPNDKMSWNPIKLRRQLRRARRDLRWARANVHDIYRHVMSVRMDVAGLEGFTEGTVGIFEEIDRENDLFTDDDR